MNDSEWTVVRKTLQEYIESRAELLRGVIPVRIRHLDQESIDRGALSELVRLAVAIERGSVTLTDLAAARAIVAEEDAEQTRRICEALAKGWASRRPITAGDIVRILESAHSDGAKGAIGVFVEMWKGDYFVHLLDRPCRSGERWAYARRVERVRGGA